MLFILVRNNVIVKRFEPVHDGEKRYIRAIYYYYNRVHVSNTTNKLTNKQKCQCDGTHGTRVYIQIKKTYLASLNSIDLLRF